MMRRALLAGIGVLLLVARGALPTHAPLWPRCGVVVVARGQPGDLTRLGPVWYYEYGFGGEVLPGHQRAYLVRPAFARQELLQAMRDRPRSWWFVGNEPNDPFQDNLSPAAYAAFYHQVVLTAQRSGSPIWLTPAGIANADWHWAEAFRTSYRQQFGRYPPVDGWNIHNYILEPDASQLDVQTFRQRVLAFREWMARSGEGAKPLFLTEFGALFGDASSGAQGPYQREDTPEEIIAFMDDVVSWMAAGDDVQAWAWFANDTRGQFHGDLFAAPGELSIFGQAYIDTVQAYCLER
jgi:hypothetical protein